MVVEAATAVTRLAPGQAEGFAALVRAQLALGQLESAEALLRERIERFPALPGPRAALAFALRRQGREAEALAVLEAADPILRDDPLLRAERAVLLGRLGRVDEGLALLGEAPDPVQRRHGSDVEVSVEVAGTVGLHRLAGVFARSNQVEIDSSAQYTSVRVEK